MEVGAATYTRAFGEDRVRHTDVFHVHDRNRHATIVGDLQDAPQIPDASFDCVILTQVLQLIYDPQATIRTLQRILRPDGVLLLTVPGITQIATKSEWGDTWYWSFTDRSVRKLLTDQFTQDSIDINVHGNVLAAVAQLHGIASSELSDPELGHVDPDYQVIITARAVKRTADDRLAATVRAARP